MPIAPTDLTQRPPRSARVRLGGYCILPRMLDKGRATIAGTQGDFKYACPLDQEFLQFAGIDSEHLRAQIGSGKGDGELLDWIMANRTNKHSAFEIEAWSGHQDRRGAGDVGKRDFFQSLQKEAGSHRWDINSWFDLLDLDDHISYGGKG